MLVRIGDVSSELPSSEFRFTDSILVIQIAIVRVSRIHNVQIRTVISRITNYDRGNLNK